MSDNKEEKIVTENLTKEAAEVSDSVKKALPDTENEENLTKTLTQDAQKVSDSVKSEGKKKKKSGRRRMIEHRLKIAGIIVGIIALLTILFFTFVASYDFSEKAWHVKFDPIHGYKYTLYLKKDYTPAHIVIESSSKGSSEVKVPESIWGVRVDELGDDVFKDSVKTVRIGSNIKTVGEGNGDKTFVLPESYGTNGFYTAFKDKDASGFYYKALEDKTLVAFAYLGDEASYQVPKTYGGITVSKAVEYYENDEYTKSFAEFEAKTSSMIPYNMVRVQLLEREGIDPYADSMTGATTHDKLRSKLLSLPQNYRYKSDGYTPADGETAIKVALVQRGNGLGKTCGDVMTEYPEREFVAAVKYLSENTAECHTTDEPDFDEWLMDGFVTP